MLFDPNMSVFTVHLLKTNVFRSIRSICSRIDPKHTPGLIHAETMMCMTLGSHILSPKRILVRQLFVFAQWENESAIDRFLEKEKFGVKLSKGWHARLAFVRQWGTIDGFDIPKTGIELDDPDAPVVAVTLARLKIPEVPRFIRWGRPVEKLVRDHPGVTLALAATRPPRTVSTFSIWKSQKDMIGMVQGRNPVSQPDRHAAAMKERNRRDFHKQFTTLRFKAISEHGMWKRRSAIIPKHQ